jgi:hypothetical protein
MIKPVATTSLPVAPPPPLSAATVDGRTLRELLSVTRDELAACLNSDTLVAAARDNEKKFASWMATTHWPQLTSQIADHLLGFLEENVATIFLGAWSKYAELRKAARETLDDTKSTVDVALADHDFVWSIRPEIDVLLNGAKVASIPFTVELACAVTALELSLCKGAINRVNSGKCNCKAQISCADFPRVWERPLAGVDLPGELRLTHPITIVH